MGRGRDRGIQVGLGKMYWKGRPGAHDTINLKTLIEELLFATHHKIIFLPSDKIETSLLSISAHGQS